MKDRIRQLMEMQNLTQNEFAELTKISAASLSSIFNDRSRPTLNHVDAIKKAFTNISLPWLLYGEGEMFISQAGGNEAASGSQSGTSNGGEQMFLNFENYGPTPQDRSFNGATPQNPSGRTNSHDSQFLKNFDKKPRQIAEIRIFFDDQTWETFVPKK